MKRSTRPTADTWIARTSLGLVVVVVLALRRCSDSGPTLPADAPVPTADAALTGRIADLPQLRAERGLGRVRLSVTDDRHRPLLATVEIDADRHVADHGSGFCPVEEAFAALWAR